MKLSDFRETLDELRATNSRNDKKKIISEVSDSPAAISFLSGSEFDSAGLGKKSVLDVAQDVFGDSVDGAPTVSECLEQFDEDEEDGKDLEVLHNHMQVLASLSGNEQKDHLVSMFKSFSYPSVVAHACLNDLPVGVGDSTIASAMGVKESLPFYDGVHEIAASADALTAPVVGRAFKPQLASSQSRSPDFVDSENMIDTDGNEWAAQLKVDGIRGQVHIKARETGQEVKVFSRRMNDITESVPELAEVDWPAGEYILDGEIISENGSYSETSERIGRKGENVERDVAMQFAVFDAIIYAGENIWSKQYRARYSRLQSLDLNTGDTVQLLPLEFDYEDAKDHALRHNEEGLILKRMDVPYEFDKRSSLWVKHKFDDCSVDLNIVGFYEGEGKASGTLGKVELETSDGVAVGNCGSGWTDEDREEVWNNQDEWLGRTVEIEGRGMDSKLRMPIFKRYRPEGEADSYSKVKQIMKEV